MTAGDGTLVEVTVTAAPADVELVADALRALAPGGVAVETPVRTTDLADFTYEQLDGPHLVRAYVPAPFPERERRMLRRRLAALPLAGPLPPVRYRDVQPERWAEEWKRFYRPMRVGRRLVIRPSWEPYEPEPGDVVVVLDPGRAFGTGQHEATRLSLAALERALAAVPQPAEVDVLDVGCGSGILSVAAALLGASSVRALDIDRAAVAATAENAERNGVSRRVRVALGSLGPEWPWTEAQERTSDLVLANISERALVELMPAIAQALRPGGRAVLAGFVERSVDGVGEAARRAGLDPERVDAEGEWRAIVARRPGE